MINKEIERQQDLYERQAEKCNEAIRQQEKWDEETKAKLQRDIKRAREQQIAELRVRKKQTKWAKYRQTNRRDPTGQ